MFIEYDSSTMAVKSASFYDFGDITEYTPEQKSQILSIKFSEMPTGSGVCYILDPAEANRVNDAYKERRSITVLIDGRGNYAGAQFGEAPPPLPEPDPEKTPEEKIGELEAENAALRSRLSDVEYAITELMLGGM